MRVMHLLGRVVQWLARGTTDLVIADSNPNSSHNVIVLRKQFTYILINQPVRKKVPDKSQLKCTDC